MLIRNARLTDAGGERAGDILIENGRIARVGGRIDAPAGCPVVDAAGLAALPAFVDLHTHFRTPGYEYKETLATGSAAAARGGYTFVNCMANTKPVCSSAAMAQSLMDDAARIGLCDINQCISITRDFDGRTVSHLRILPHNLRFISEDGKGVRESKVMYQAMAIAAEKGLTVMSHAEDMDLSPIDYRLAENLETARNLYIAQSTGARLHMCHVSTREAMEDIITAKARGVKVTCEVTPHHIWFDDTVSSYRVNPPIRAKADVEYLIAAIEDGDVDAIATDHAPHTEADKAAGAPGLVGLETAFAVCYTRLCVQRGLPLSTLSRLMSKGPADILGLNKGLLAEGYDGDVVLAELEQPFTVRKEDFAGRSRNTPFDGLSLRGRVVMTVKAGKVTYRAPDAPAARPCEHL